MGALGFSCWKPLVVQEQVTLGLELLLLFLQGLFPTHCRLLAGLEPADAAGSDGPMSPACGALVCSSHFLTLQIKPKQEQQKKKKKKRELSRPNFPLDL